MNFLDYGFANALDQILNIESPRQILLVTGDGSYDSSPVKNYFDTLDIHLLITRLNGLGRNPNYERLCRAIDDLKNAEFDLIIAVGGGSVLDYAKLIALYLGNRDILSGNFIDIKEVKVQTPLVAIPTTAGTGSEATHFAVLYKEKNKYSIATNEILPRHVIVDPVLTYSMSPSLTASTGLDALCQAIESLWAKGATTKSREYAKKALHLIVPHLERAVLSPDVASRKAMAIGAYHAGQAINISKTTGPHALSYQLTNAYGIPHGEAVAMTMEVFFEFNYPYLDEEVKIIFNDVFCVESPGEFREWFSKLKEKIGLRQNIWDAGVQDDIELNALISSLNWERMNNNPSRIDPVILLSKLR